MFHKDRSKLQREASLMHPTASSLPLLCQASTLHNHKWEGGAGNPLLKSKLLSSSGQGRARSAEGKRCLNTLG